MDRPTSRDRSKSTEGKTLLAQEITSKEPARKDTTADSSRKTVTKITTENWVCAYCDAVNHWAQEDCHNCRAARKVSKRSNWVSKCEACDGALERDQVCDCHTLHFENKYRYEQPPQICENPWKFIECKCERPDCKNKHYTEDEKFRIKKALWAHKPFHPEGTFRPPTTEACLSMALHCRCKFGQECRFSHDPAQFPPGLKATVRSAGKCPPQVNRQDRDFQQPPPSRKRPVDEPYSLRGHGQVEPKYARVNQRGSGIGGKGDHRMGRGKGASRQYASSDVIAAKGEKFIQTSIRPKII